MLRVLSFSIFVVFLLGCQPNKIKFPEAPEIIGLASPVYLNLQETEVNLEDYFLNYDRLDSLIIPDQLMGELSADKKYLTLSPNTDKLPQLMVLKVWIQNFPYSILLKKTRKMNFTFTFDPGNKTYKQVQISGEINGWNPKESNLQYKDDLWQIDLEIYPGKYHYQMVLDGEWVVDPNNMEQEENNLGGINSVLYIGENTDELTPEIYTYKFEENLIALGIQNNADNVIAFWQNYQIPDEKIIFKENSIIISLPVEARKYDRSWVRIWAENEYGPSNDVLIPLHKLMVVDNPKQLTRSDWEASVFYFLMIDRFKNGTKNNDFPVDDPEILPQANYYGGDLVGITNKIKDGYFEDLGVNTIWLSPITQNPLEAYGLWPDPRTKFSGYHGYWPVSLSTVDFRFGTDEELVTLIETAHQHNINVILDFVSNHVHENNPLIQEHPEWATELYLPDGTLNTEKWDEYRLTTWFDTFLPTLDLENPEVTDVISDSAVFWIENYNLDGFRHDATKHIPEIYWRTLTKKLKERVVIPQNKRIYQVGETYGNRELIGSYINSGMLDGQFDFGVYDAAVSAFARDDEPFEKLVGSLQESLDHYGYHNLMGYISGNQDKPRFISLAGGDLKFDEDSKLAGWTREIGIGDVIAYKKLQSLNAFNLTIPGIPTIYYGDEMGMPGANDPDNRRLMQFEGLNPEEIITKEITKDLIHLRRNNLCLTYGDFNVLYVDDYTLAYMRSYFDKTAIIVFNKSKKPLPVLIKIPARFKNSDFHSNFDTEFNLTGTDMKIFIEGNSFDIITN